MPKTQKPRKCKVIRHGRHLHDLPRSLKLTLSEWPQALAGQNGSRRTRRRGITYSGGLTVCHRRSQAIPNGYERLPICDGMLSGRLSLTKQLVAVYILSILKKSNKMRSTPQATHHSLTLVNDKRDILPHVSVLVAIVAARRPICLQFDQAVFSRGKYNRMATLHAQRHALSCSAAEGLT